MHEQNLVKAANEGAQINFASVCMAWHGNWYGTLCPFFSGTSLPWFVCSAAVLFGCLIQNTTVACKKGTIFYQYCVIRTIYIKIINYSCIGWAENKA